MLGTVPFRTDFAQSCNTAFVGSAGKVSAAQLADAAKALGYGAAAGLGVQAFGGSVPTSGDAVEHAADMIGQGKVLASPLSVATASASVAAGTPVTPRLVRRRRAVDVRVGLPAPVGPPSAGAPPQRRPRAGHGHRRHPAGPHARRGHRGDGDGAEGRARRPCARQDRAPPSSAPRTRRTPTPGSPATRATSRSPVSSRAAASARRSAAPIAADFLRRLRG